MACADLCRVEDMARADLCRVEDMDVLTCVE